MGIMPSMLSHISDLVKILRSWIWQNAEIWSIFGDLAVVMKYKTKFIYIDRMQYTHSSSIDMTMAVITNASPIINL